MSSTIHDFKDLRASLKYWLEEFGYEVMLSEFSDFQKNLDINSYQACLSAIEECQYFILFIGSRVGGYFDEIQKISITRNEYRKAYKLLLAGKIRLVTFIRRDIWNIREDRKDLLRYLQEIHAKDIELSVTEISNHPSKFINDAEAIFSFIDEVSRSREMENAMKNKTGFPAGNWIHLFDNFREIVDVLRPVFGVTASLRKKTLEANLRHELLSNLSNFLVSKSGKIKKDFDYARLAVRELTFPLDMSEETVVDAPTANSLRLLCLANPCAKLQWVFLEEALCSGEFLEWDSTKDVFIAGPLQKILLQLRDAIHSSLPGDLIDYASIWGQLTKDVNKKIRFKNPELLSIVMLFDMLEHLSSLMVAALKILSGNTQSRIHIKPRFREGMHDFPIKKNLSIDEIYAWIKDSVYED